MKVSDAPLDDVVNDADFVLRDDGGKLAIGVLWLIVRLARALLRLVLATLRLPWRHGDRQ